MTNLPPNVDTSSALIYKNSNCKYDEKIYLIAILNDLLWYYNIIERISVFTSFNFMRLRSSEDKYLF